MDKYRCQWAYPRSVCVLIPRLLDKALLSAIIVIVREFECSLGLCMALRTAADLPMSGLKAGKEDGLMQVRVLRVFHDGYNDQQEVRPCEKR